MKSRLLIYLFFTFFSFSFTEKEMVEFYVSPIGNDKNIGTKVQPYATLERAFKAVRALKQGAGLPLGGVTIWLRGGEHNHTKPLIIRPEDSGEEEKPVIIAAYADEKPVLFGGRRITGFKEKAKGIWEVAVPEAKNKQWIFRTLYVNGKRYTLARSPNKGYYYMTGAVSDESSPKEGIDAGKSKSAFMAPPGLLKPWTDLDQANLKIWGRWWTTLMTIKNIDESSGEVKLMEPGFQYLPYRQRKSTPFIVENHLGALDEPGEWQLDRGKGVLKVIPRPGDDLKTAEVYAPFTEQVMLFEGDPANNKYVEYIEFHGISFQCSNWILPPEGGNEGAQAAVNIGAMVEAVGTRNCLFEQCEFTRIDSNALWFRRGCNNNIVRHCHIHDLGAGGVKIGEGSLFMEKEKKENPENRVSGMHVENCYIHNGGHIHGAAVGVWIGASSDNVITHNEICDLWYTGISVGWKWSTDLNDTRNNHITFNHIHHVVQRLEDGGAIYCLGLQPQTVISNNLIHDIGRDDRLSSTDYEQPSHCRGIYLDQGCAGFLIENNIIYDMQDAAIRMQIGTNSNLFLNNIIAFTRQYAVDFEPIRTNIFMNNIIYIEYGNLFKFDNWPNYDKYISDNIYWRTDGKPIYFAGLTWEEWRNRETTPFLYIKGSKMDEGSVIADPQFENAAKRKFQLKSTSPAFDVGFQSINIEGIGLIGNETWKSLPRRCREEILLGEDLYINNNSIKK